MKTYSIMVYDTLTGSFLDRIFIYADNMEIARIFADDIMTGKTYTNHSLIRYTVIS